MSGRIEICTGPMFAGKSTEFLRRIERYEIAKKNVVVFKPAIDNRYSDKEIVTHSGLHRTSVVVKNNSAEEIHKYLCQEKDHLKQVDVIAIDEFQFFDSSLVQYVYDYKIRYGKKVILCGLDMDWRGKPFVHVAPLFCMADKVSKLKAVCKCGKDATMTNKKDKLQLKQVDVGGIDKYEALCLDCWILDNQSFNNTSYFNQPQKEEKVSPFRVIESFMSKRTQNEIR